MIRYLVLLLAVVCIASCGGDSGTDTGVNHAPTISFVSDMLAVQKGISVDLEVAVDDEDGDPLSVTWTVSQNGGALDPNDQGNTVMTWTPPPSTGSHTITATVTDGEKSASASIQLQSATVWTTDVLGSTISWTLQQSPYIIRQNAGDLNFIISGGRLIINPGVTVLIDVPEQEINVNGILDIRGTVDQPVTIKPNRRVPSAGFWKGVYADLAASLVMRYTVVTHAVHNVRLDTEAAADLRWCRLSHSSIAGFYARSTGSLIMKNCQVTENDGDGLSVEIISAFPDSIVVTDSNLMYNGDSGADIKLPSLPGAPVFFEFSGDSIAYNDVNGINLVTNAYPTIHNNWIFFNDITRLNNGFNIRVDPGFIGFSDSIDARYNFWGRDYMPADTTEIASLMYDKRDNPALPEVRFIPWCNDPPCLVE